MTELDAAIRAAIQAPGLTTDYVRDFYAKFQANLKMRCDYEDEAYERAEAEFDRWLAGVLADAKAQAWDEGAIWASAQPQLQPAHYAGHDVSDLKPVGRVWCYVCQRVVDDLRDGG